MSLFSPLVEQATEIAAEWHDRTYRKSRWRQHPYDPPPEAAMQIPVMAHLSAVAFIVERAGWDDATVAAAFLHDILEDGNQYEHTMSYAALAALVGPEVADRVRGVTEPKCDAEGYFLPWRTRKEAYLDTLRAGTAESMAISLADKLHNVWTMNQGIEAGLDLFGGGPGSLSAGPDQQRWYFHSVLDASAAFDDPRLEPMRARLREEVARFETLTGTEAQLRPAGRARP
ncbi:MAG: HD domain-containing protein [Bacteroidota bacterium]